MRIDRHEVRLNRFLMTPHTEPGRCSGNEPCGLGIGLHAYARLIILVIFLPVAPVTFASGGEMPGSAGATHTPARNAEAAPGSLLAPASGTIHSSFLTMDTLDDTYKLVLGDRLSFRILEDQVDPREPLEPKRLVVTDSGAVEVPYIGRFPSEGKTCKQLAQELKAELEQQYYYKATVIIAVDQKSRSSGNVYVAGSVHVVGPIELPGTEVLTLSKAILRAGGFTDFADKRRVKVTRKIEASGGEQSQSFIVDLTEVLEHGRTGKDLKLESGDSIFVPARSFRF